MAFGAVGQISTKSTKVAGPSWTITDLGSTILAGQLLVLGFGGDNRVTVSGITNDHQSVTVAGASMTKLGEVTYAPGSGGSGTTVSLWMLIAPVGGFASTDDVVITYGGSFAVKLMNGYVFSLASGSTVVEDGEDVTTYGALDWPAISVTPGNSGEHLYIRIGSMETSTSNAANMPSSGWTSIGSLATTGGNALNNATIDAEFKISSASSETSDPAGIGTNDQAHYMVAIREVLAAAGPPSRATALQSVQRAAVR